MMRGPLTGWQAYKRAGRQTRSEAAAQAARLPFLGGLAGQRGQAGEEKSTRMLLRERSLEMTLK